MSSPLRQFWVPALLLWGCSNRVDRAVADRPSVTDPAPRVAPASQPASVRTAVAAAPRSVGDGCASAPLPVVSPAWSLRGYHPGPSFLSLVAAGPHHRTLVGGTSSHVCIRDDEGERWRDPLPRATLDHPEVSRLGGLDALLIVAQGTALGPATPQVFVSFNEGEDWSPVTLPPEAIAAGSRARVFTDRARRLFVTDGAHLWRSDDARTFSAPSTLPGSESDQVDACGDTLIARAHIGEDLFFHRSDDHGRSWRPFRLGAIGLEGANVMLRCIGWRGGIEAGRAPLPTHWSFDQGRTWEPARYDAEARAIAHTLSDDPSAEGEAPRCAQTPGGQLMCTDSGRLVLPDAGHRAEVHAPAHCDRLRLLDDQRMVAFGPTCGVLISTDRGGLWRSVSSATTARTGTTLGGGRGGFLSRDVAWRLDGGLWWTRDGGEHWRIVPSPTGRTLERGTFVDESRGVFAQTGGWVLSTRDGGRSWTYVLRGEVERIASGGAWVMVTTSDRVRLSPDGGQTWRTSGTIPSTVPIQVSVEVYGTQRRIDLSPELRVVQQGDAVSVVRAEGGQRRTTELVRAIARGHELVAAHATGDAVDRVMLGGGAMLVRTTEVSRR